MNRYKAGELSAEEILLNAKNYTKPFLTQVFNDFVEQASAEKIMQHYEKFITKDSLFKIVSRINKSKNALEIAVEDLEKLISSVELDKKEYLDIAKAIAKGMMPEDRLKLFESLSEKDENAMEAYLFTAFDLEMMELADEILESSSPEEYKNFRAYRELKEHNKNYSIELFV
jgi:hypothetical protein